MNNGHALEPIRTCRAKTKNGHRCRTCLKTPFKTLCEKHEYDQGIETWYRTKNEDTVYMDPNTCYIQDSNGDDAEFKHTRCSQLIQKKCLDGKALRVPQHDKLTFAEKRIIQTLATSMISSHPSYYELAIDMVGLTINFMKMYIAESYMYVKGSTAMRVHVEEILRHSDHIGLPTSLHKSFENVLKHSDIDSFVVINPAIERFNDYAKYVGEVISGYLYKHISSINVDILEDMLNTLQSPFDEIKSIMSVHRAPFQITSGCKKPYPLIIRRLILEESEIQVECARDNIYRVNNCPIDSIHVFSFSSDPLILYEPILHENNCIMFHKLSLIKQRGFVVFDWYDYATCTSENSIVIDCTFRESQNHIGGLMATLDEPLDMHNIPNRIRSVKYGHGVVVSEKQIMFPTVNIIPRGALFAREKTSIQSSSRLTISSNIVHIDSIQADFILIRVIMPMKVVKNNMSYWSKAEVLDISIALAEDVEHQSSWKKFSPQTRTEWTDVIVYNEKRIPSVSLAYQLQDLKRMKLDLYKNGMYDIKAGKRQDRYALLQSVNSSLGIADGTSGTVMLGILKNYVGIKAYDKVLANVQYLFIIEKDIKPSMIPLHFMSEFKDGIPNCIHSLMDIYRMFGH